MVAHIGMPSSLYQAMETKGVHWFCDRCDNKFGEILKDFVMLKSKQEEFGRELQGVKQTQEKFQHEIVIMKEKQDKMDKAATDLDEKVNQLDEVLGRRITDIEESLKQKAEATEVDDIKKSYSEVAQVRQLNSLDTDEAIEKFKQKIESEQAEAQKVIEQRMKILEEERDKERRRNNVIIYRVAESTDTSPQDRAQSDNLFVKQLTNKALKMGIVDDDIKRVIRLGKKEDKDRPMLVEFRSHIIKNQMMESLSMLKEAEERYRNISVSHDMTKMERSQCKETVAIAYEKKDADKSGEYKYMVKGLPGHMAVVKIKLNKRTN